MTVNWHSAASPILSVGIAFVPFDITGIHSHLLLASAIHFLSELEAFSERKILFQSTFDLNENWDWDHFHCLASTYKS